MDVDPEPDQRVGKPPDAAALAAVLIEGFESYRAWAPEGWSPVAGHGVARQIAERLAEPDYWCLLAEADGQAVGYVVIRQSRTLDEQRVPLPGVAHLWHLFVRTAWWGSGLASRLLSEAMTEAARRGYSGALLWTPRDNARSRAFYRREGWRETGRERYGADIDLDLVEYGRCLVP